MTKRSSKNKLGISVPAFLSVVSGQLFCCEPKPMRLGEAMCKIPAWDLDSLYKWIRNQMKLDGHYPNS